MHTKNGYLCPNCRVFAPNFSCFLSNHASDFVEGKKTMFQSCKQNVGTPCYIWQESIDKQKEYYRFHDQYLCPACRILVSDFGEFVSQHKHNAGAFEKSKSSYTPINKQQQPPQRLIATMSQKRKLNDSLPFKESTQLNRCHRVIELDLHDMQFTSVETVLSHHRDEIVIRLQGFRDVKMQLSVNCLFVRTVDGQEGHKEWYISNKARPFPDNLLFLLEVVFLM